MIARRTTLILPAKAFTLLELLIATAACAVVLAAIFGVFSRAIHLRDDATARTREARVRTHAANVIRNDLRNAWISGKKLAIVLKGSHESQQGGFPGYFSCTTTTGSNEPNEIGAELQQVEYYIAEDPAASDRKAGLLVRTVDRYLLAPVREKPVEQPLLPGIESMEVSFYDGGSWKETWEVTEEDRTLPLAIRFLLQPAGDPKSRQKPAPIEIMVPWSTQAQPTPVPQ